MNTAQTPERFTLEKVAALATEIALKQEHLPTVIAQGSEQAIVGQMPEFPDTPEGRIKFMYVAGYLMGKQGMLDGLEEVFIVMEAWMSIRQKDDDLRVQPSQDPEALEILLISALTVATNSQDFRVFEIVSEAEKRIELKEIPFESEDKIQAESPLLEAFVVGFAVGSAEQS